MYLLYYLYNRFLQPLNERLDQVTAPIHICPGLRIRAGLEETHDGSASHLARSHVFVDGRKIVQRPSDVMALDLAILHVGQHKS